MCSIEIPKNSAKKIHRGKNQNISSGHQSWCNYVRVPHPSLSISRCITTLTWSLIDSRNSIVISFLLLFCGSSIGVYPPNHPTKIDIIFGRFFLGWYCVIFFNLVTLFKKPLELPNYR